ncbi:MAG TPA: hypothetical protein VJI15_06575 [Candidatus Nanoarchaeia archaeon]|nr:hypothetical protein [Candidatus Nanoarchaeia archaeon]
MKTPLLEEIALELGKRTFPWEEAWNATLKDSPTEAWGPGKIGTMYGRLAEVGIQLNLQQLASSLPGVQVVDFPPQVTTNNYRFQRARDGRVLVYHREGPRDPLMDLDAVFLAGELPVLAEVKLGSGKTTAGASRKGGRGISSARLSYHLNPERIAAVLSPLEEYFNSKYCGCLVVVPPENIRPNSPIQQEFMANGGILVPFYYSRQSYQQKIAELVAAKK